MRFWHYLQTHSFIKQIVLIKVIMIDNNQHFPSLRANNTINGKTVLSLEVLDCLLRIRPKVAVYCKSGFIKIIEHLLKIFNRIQAILGMCSPRKCW